MQLRVGYVGLGIMGQPMALNLIKAGYSMAVYARRKESMTPLLNAGAQGCASPAEVARNADVVFTNVSDTPDVEAMVLGENGILRGAMAGTIVVDMSTISPVATRAIKFPCRSKRSTIPNPAPATSSCLVASCRA